MKLAELPTTVYNVQNVDGQEYACDVDTAVDFPRQDDFCGAHASIRFEDEPGNDDGTYLCDAHAEEAGIPDEADGHAEWVRTVEWEIAWTFSGYTTVQAATEDEAREKFRELDHSTILARYANPRDADLDVAGVARA